MARKSSYFTWMKKEAALAGKIEGAHIIGPPEAIPPCAASMGCLCAGHARGNSADAPCDTDERMNPRDAACALIAAAPDLYEALRELLTDAEAYEENGDRFDRERNDRARAALAKAEGRS